MSDETLDRIRAAREEALARVDAASSLSELRDVEVATTGRKAPLSDIKSGMGALSAAERPVVGRAIQEAIADLEGAIAVRRSELEAAEETVALASERVDVTLPGRRVPAGHPHPISLMLDRIVDVFVAMGYRVAEGPEVETDWYNFEALNMPPDHAARSMWDTLYLAGVPTMLRT
ncbi:MAG: phenylalanine--tRNA ligase subunit alpha, partial [Chloroflexi bacterium]|nr:phenylalanine--tRNA ligase subunit alpha [Chloroflexota bacterium]